jgi:hypothetical protein
MAIREQRVLLWRARGTLLLVCIQRGVYEEYLITCCGVVSFCDMAPSMRCEHYLASGDVLTVTVRDLSTVDLQQARSARTQAASQPRRGQILLHRQNGSL